MSVVVTNQQTTFTANTNPDITVETGAGNVTANTERVVIASDQPAIPVTGTFFLATQPVSGTVTADTELPAASALSSDAISIPTTSIIAGVNYTFNGTSFDRLRGTQTKGMFVDVKSTAINGTSAVTSVSASVTVVNLLNFSGTRVGGTIYNDSSSILYVKLGNTASSTSFTVILAGNTATGIGGYYELPYNWTGVVTGIWVTATGGARVTEVSP